MAIKIITVNVNGIRSAAKKGLFDWLAKEQADIVCLQEVRAHAIQITEEHFKPKGYYCYYFDAEKKGYSGVAVYSRIEPLKVETKLGWATSDQEGRYLQVDFDKVNVASLYMPSGTSGEHRQSLKYEYMNHFYQFLKNIREQNKEFIICGDWNIAHKEIDLKNWRTNQKTTGFLPEERAWLTQVFDELGFVDAFRVVNQEPDQYTWWSQRAAGTFERNIGWRIDYQIVTPGLKQHIQSASIYKDQRFSDHAPLIMTYDCDLK